MELNGKAAVVTGGATGIGLGIARALAEKGSRVMLADVDLDKAEAAAASLREAGADAHAARCDVSKHDDVVDLADKAWATFGSVQIVYNNAGVMSSAPVIDYDPREVDWIIDINLKGVWNGCSVFGKRFRDGGEESAIGITASEHAIGVPHLGGGVYTASKHALLGMGDVMRQELPEHVHVTLLFPGITSTELYDAQRSSPVGPTPEKARGFGAKMMAEGMDANYVGRRAVEGIEQDEPFVLTHPHTRAFAEKRWQDLDAAYARAPEVENAGDYDVAKVLARVLAENRRDT